MFLLSGGSRRILYVYGRVVEMCTAMIFVYLHASKDVVNYDKTRVHMASSSLQEMELPFSIQKTSFYIYKNCGTIRTKKPETFLLFSKCNKNISYVVQKSTVNLPNTCKAVRRLTDY